MATTQRFCLRWNNHQSNLLSVFDQLLHDEAFVDVTLAVEGQFLRAHKMVLSACSPYFQSLFVGHPDRHPIVILKDVPYADMRSLLDFMYRGEVSVDQERLTAFLKVAESLRIKGLTEVNEERCDLPSIASSLLSSTPTAPPPPPNLHRIHTLGHKRVLAPLAANPLLGSALTAPKRKRGRPRKLSGSSNGPHTPGDTDPPEQELRLHHPDRADSPVMGPPDLLEVNMGNDSDHNPSQNDESALDTEDTDTKPDKSEIDELDEKSIKQEPTPGPSQDSSFKGNSSQDVDPFGPVLENAQQAVVLVSNDVHHLPPPREVLHKLKKNEDRDAKGARVRKRCRVCSKKGLDRRTVYLCSNCPGNPAFCPSECFGNFHDTLANQGTT